MRGRRWLTVAIGPLAALAASFVLVGSVHAAGAVGTGTAGSCTEAAFDTAFAGGGTITFNCGPAPVTITFLGTKIPSAATTIDGGGLITLSGGDAVPLFSTGYDLTLSNITLSHGAAGGFGGAVSANNANLTFLNATVSDNHVGGYGGAVGISVQGGETNALNIFNSTFTGNTSDGYAGAIYAISSAGITPSCDPPSQLHVQIVNSTFTGNTSVNGGSVLMFDIAPLCPTSGDALILYSTLAGNTGQSLLYFNPGSSGQAGGNVIGPNTSTSTCALAGPDSIGYNVTDDFCLYGALSSDKMVADTMLGPLASNGGLTQTMALLPGSPALDIVPAGTLECGDGLTEDQRNEARPQGTNCDAGAYEQVVLSDTATAPQASGPMPTAPLLVAGLLLIGAALATATRRVRARP